MTQLRHLAPRAVIAEMLPLAVLTSLACLALVWKDPSRHFFPKLKKQWVALGLCLVVLLLHAYLMWALGDPAFASHSLRRNAVFLVLIPLALWAQRYAPEGILGIRSQDDKDRALAHLDAACEGIRTSPESVSFGAAFPFLAGDLAQIRVGRQGDVLLFAGRDLPFLAVMPRANLRLEKDPTGGWRGWFPGVAYGQAHPTFKTFLGLGPTRSSFRMPMPAGFWPWPRSPDQKASRSRSRLSSDLSSPVSPGAPVSSGYCPQPWLFRVQAPF